jgi:two-component system, NarL family, sensor histidine kinase UhpB
VPLLWKVFVGNAAVLAIATLVLVISPATVSFPVALWEVAVLVPGLAAMLALDFVLLRRALAPLQRLAAFARAVDPLHPGARSGLAAADPEVRDVALAVDEMLDRLEAERRESARVALAVQEAERVRIARELHDEVGQALTGVLLLLDQRDGELEELREAVRGALGDVREIARRLRPEALDDLGVLAALAALSVQVQRTARVRVERELNEVGELTSEEELVIYRVAQEALTNVARHAQARRATLRLRRERDGVVLEVADDGRGLPRELGEGAGLRGMRERAVLVGGRVELSGRAGGGTVVRLVLKR